MKHSVETFYCCGRAWTASFEVSQGNQAVWLVWSWENCTKMLVNQLRTSLGSAACATPNLFHLSVVQVSGKFTVIVYTGTAFCFMNWTGNNNSIEQVSMLEYNLKARGVTGSLNITLLPVFTR